MKHFSKPLTAMGLALAISAGALTPAMAETLKVAWSQDATGLDPHKQTAFSSIRFLELIYEPLVRLDADAAIAPALANFPLPVSNLERNGCPAISNMLTLLRPL